MTRPVNEATYADRSVEFWFEFGSNYSYPSVMRIEEAAARGRVAVVWKPFMLGPIFKSFGWDNSPFVLQKKKGAYMWQDMPRVCEKYGIPWRKPTTFPRLAVLPIRVALVGAESPWIGGFCKRMMLKNFALDQEINSLDAVAEVLADMDLDAAGIIEQAQSDQNKTRLREQIEAARSKGIFGAPTFFVGGEMFWGNDRLDDALALAAGRACA